MKKLTLVTLTAFLCFFSMKAQLRMDCDGDVGIGPFYGGEPLHQFHVEGFAYFRPRPALSGYYFQNYGTRPIILPELSNSAYIGQSYAKIYSIYTYYLNYNYLYQNSDLSIKENIRNIESPLSTISNIRGVIFDYKRDYYNDSPEDMKEKLVEEGKNNIGFIAQELQEVVPKLVKYNEESELHDVNYVGLIPILVEAIKEQQTIIDNLIDEVSELKSESLDNFKSALITTDDNLSEQTNKPILFQNRPNPFTENTQIDYYISENVNLANIYIFNMNGTQLKNFDLHQKGYGNITINGSDLNAGMYMYALIANGRMIDTKRMILTD